MHSGLVASVLASLCLSVAAQNTSAPIVYDNPPNVYELMLLDKTNTTVRGYVRASAPSSGVGVRIHADFWGLPDEGPYQYHIHEFPVPPDGNCYSTLGHLDPYRRGEQPPCNPNLPETCQVGDLSGKHGVIFVGIGEPFETEYTDLFLSTNPEDPAFIGNRSIVVHAPNSARLNCGNFVNINTETHASETRDAA
ncbi:hypothetical protein MPDQ_001764 [Monascus purpureus]|uniref:superoxide dismutase n=1 Tax=Monascus purpureus TaxID=5098 RepID=A0A507R2J9_MONPU|nr:hypothetical protein MPDQ_001764 [Monascus purpureus]BDD59655.1 hypothetical protein MAP00_004850 [Monascus purpureus]